MDLDDPLAEFRAGEASSVDELERHLDERGLSPIEFWHRGGPPVALTGSALFFVDDETLYRIDRERIRGLGQTRAADSRRMGLGALLYLVGLPITFLVGNALAQVVVGPLTLIAGGILVVLGYLSKALLIQVDDERVPPFVLEHRRWKKIGRSLSDWLPAETRGTGR